MSWVISDVGKLEGAWAGQGWGWDGSVAGQWCKRQTMKGEDAALHRMLGGTRQDDEGLSLGLELPLRPRQALPTHSQGCRLSAETVASCLDSQFWSWLCSRCSILAPSQPCTRASSQLWGRSQDQPVSTKMPLLCSGKSVEAFCCYLEAHQSCLGGKNKTPEDIVEIKQMEGYQEANVCPNLKIQMK